MNVKPIIALALAQGDNVPESDAGYIDRRRRALTFLRDVFTDVWWSRDWPWKKTISDVTVLAGENNVAVPSNFDSLGVYGGVYRLVGGIQQYPPLEEVPESIILERRSGNGSDSNPRVFSFFDQDPDTQQLLLQIPNASADVPLRLHYQKRPPKLYDAGDPEPEIFTLAAGAVTRVGQVATVVTPNPHSYDMFERVVIAGAVEPEYNGTFEVIVTGLTTFTYVVTGTPATPATGTITAQADVLYGDAALRQIPERFHNKALLNGLKSKLREAKGDARWQKLDTDYAQGVKNMKTELARFQSEIKQLPSFFGDRNPRGIS